MSGAHVSACDVSDHCCKEGHGHPGEERVLRSAGRERGWCLLHRLVLLFIYVIKGFKLVHLSAEAQDPDSEAQGSAGCTYLFWNLVQGLCFKLVDYYSSGFCVAGHDE